MKTINVTDRAAELISSIREQGAIFIKKADLFDLLTYVIDTSDEHGGANDEEYSLIATLCDMGDLVSELSKKYDTTN